MIQSIITRFNGKQARHTFSVIWRGSARHFKGRSSHFERACRSFLVQTVFIQDPAHINNFIFPVMAFFPEPKSFGSAHGWPAEGRPAGGGQRAPARGRSLRAAERRRNQRSAAAADCGESNGINKADSELSDKARCDSWTVTITTSEAAAKPLVRYFKLWCHCQHKGQRKRFLSSCVSVSPASRYGAFRVAGHASDRSVGGTQAHLQPEPASASAAPVPAHNPQADLDSDSDADRCKVGRLERPQVSVYYIS